MARCGTGRRVGAGAVVAAAVVVTAAGCGPGGERAGAAEAGRPRFVEVTREAGLVFVHETGAFGARWLPETMGAGCAWLDADGDGRPDLFLVQGRDWPGHGDGDPDLPALYRNRGDGTFEDVAAAAGLAVEAYGMGAVVGDYDDDGDADLFVSALGPNLLFENLGDGTFREVGSRAGVADPGFGAGATFLDYDRDGRLDLFVTSYVDWTEATDLFCTLDGTRKAYCTPEPYPGATNRLYRNRGDGTFEDVTVASGIGAETGKSLGVVAFDHDLDGWPDLAVSNDTMRNFLFHNNGDGTFTEIGRRAGIAYSEAGDARAGMGIDAGDYDGSGREAVAIGNFSAEMVALYHSRGPELYSDEAAAAGVGAPSLWTLAFGTFFFDYDLDGRLDLFVANGHVEPDVAAVQKQVSWEQPAHLFRNLGGGRFADVLAGSGSDLARPMVARGAAYADYDGDGDLDVAVTTNGGPARLFRNDASRPRNALRVDLVGTDGARDAYGARLVLTVDGRTLVRTRRGGSSYLSQSEATVTFGLGASTRAERLEVFWPSGRRQVLRDLPAGSIVVVEGEGDDASEGR